MGHDRHLARDTLAAGSASAGRGGSQARPSSSDLAREVARPAEARVAPRSRSPRRSGERAAIARSHPRRGRGATRAPRAGRRRAVPRGSELVPSTRTVTTSSPKARPSRARPTPISGSAQGDEDPEDPTVELMPASTAVGSTVGVLVGVGELGLGRQHRDALARRHTGSVGVVAVGVSVTVGVVTSAFVGTVGVSVGVSSASPSESQSASRRLEPEHRASSGASLGRLGSESRWWPSRVPTVNDSGCRPARRRGRCRAPRRRRRRRRRPGPSTDMVRVAGPLTHWSLKLTVEMLSVPSSKSYHCTASADVRLVVRRRSMPRSQPPSRCRRCPLALPSHRRRSTRRHQGTMRPRHPGTRQRLRCVRRETQEN